MSIPRTWYGVLIRTEREFWNTRPSRPIFTLQHKHNRVEAEKAQGLQDRWRALQLYERAIQCAKHRFLHEEALAHETDWGAYAGSENKTRTDF